MYTYTYTYSTYVHTVSAKFTCYFLDAVILANSELVR
jgi:hypothetical protein